VPTPSGAVLPILVFACLGAWSSASPALPPIRYSGELRFTNRAIVPEERDNTYLFGRTARLNLESFIWQPWFANIGGTFDFNWVDTRGESDSAAKVLGGEARVNLFPQSRFPSFGFVNLTDSRSNFESLQIPERHTRTSRFGFAQHYQPLSGNARFAARVDRSIEDGTSDDLQAIIDRADLNMSYRATRHVLTANVNVKDTSRDLNDEDLFEFVGTLNHNYRPTGTLSVDSFATLTDTSAESQIVTVGNRTFLGNSLAVWRPRRMPLTVSGTARVTASQQQRDGTGNDSNSGNLALGADYLVNRLTRLTGNANVTITDENTSSLQSATLSYNPDPLALKSFSYSYFTSTSVNNQIGTTSGDRTVFGVLFGHGVTRSRAADFAPAWTLSLGANQTLSGSLDTVEGSAGTMGLSASTGLARGAADGLTRVRLNATDQHSFGASRSFATGDNSFQSVNFNFTHNQNFSRYSNWSGNLSMGYTRQEFGSGTTTSEFTNVSLGYTHTRLFGVQRMLFRSTFDARTLALLFDDFGAEEGTDLKWENRIDYTIGKLEARLTGVWNRVRGRNGYTLLFTLSRKFDGAL